MDRVQLFMSTGERFSRLWHFRKDLPYLRVRQRTSRLRKAIRTAVSEGNSELIFSSMLDSFSLPRSIGADEAESLLSDLRQQAFETSRADDFRLLYQMSEMMSKCTSGWVEGVTPSDRRQAALSSFFDAEKRCAAYTAPLAGWESSASVPTDVLRLARHLIRGVLGPLDLNELPGACGFGPGASSFLKRSESSQQNKWQKSRHITARALPYLSAFTKWAQIDLDFQVEVVDGNKVTTVDKSWNKDRIIAIEPCWNGFFQHGAGKMLRRRLQRIGLLHRDAQAVNRLLARTGSQDKTWCTIDLKSASDTVSYALVRALLPPDWFALLADLRSEVGTVDGKKVWYYKFSSMGNGYTFELETLIFWALMSAASKSGNRSQVKAYGDDLIVHREDLTRCIEVLTSVGLEVNRKKSFWGDHPFRESCGGHYFNGVDVTPFYVRGVPATMGDYINLHNQSRQWARNTESLAVWGKVLRIVPSALRGPYGMSGALWTTWDQAKPLWDRHLQAYEVMSISRVAKYADISSWSGSYLYKLWSPGDDDLQATETSRLARSSSKEKLVVQYADRHGWDPDWAY